MNLNALRWIDEIFGPIIARFLFIVGFIVGRSRKLKTPLEYKTVEKVLIIKFFGGGSILLASPAIYSIKKIHPDAHISIITLFENKEICSLLKAIDKIYYLDLKNPFSFFLKYFKLLREIKNKNYDFIVDLEFLTNFSALTTLLISIASKPCATIGFSSPSKWRNKIYSIAIPFDHSRHITEIFAKLFFHLVEKPFKVDFKIPQKDIVSLAELSPLTKEFLDKLSVANNIVCVNINAGKICHLRRWPQENYAKLILDLHNRFGTKTVLIGGKEDVGYVESFIEKIPKKIDIFNLCGKLSIKELVGLFTKSRLLITNDSGPLHIASIVGLPTISFFGPETPYLYGPLGPGHHVFYEDIFCSPCINIYNAKASSCNNNTCLKSIGSEIVMKTIEEKNFLT
jgi:ADP-heptose:LPS heptosyltransferase